MNKKLIVIGGGAAGLLCAIQVARAVKSRGDKVDITVLEKNDRVGKKLLVTGNGKCNLLNTNASAKDYYSEQFVESANLYTPAQVEKLFKELGILTTCDASGRVYPKSESASCVLNTLRLTAETLGIKLVTGCTVRKIEKVSTGYSVSGTDTYKCDSLVIATGSPAGVKDYCGTLNLKQLGVSVVTQKPALSPVLLREKTPSLKGVRVKANITLDKYHSSGEVQFGDGYLSGICVMDLSRFVKESGSKLSIDTVSNLTYEELLEFLTSKAQNSGKLPSQHLLCGVVNKNLATYVLKKAGISPASLCKELSSSKLRALTSVLKSLEFTVYHNKDFSRAQVATGGVKTTEIDTDTLALKSLPNCYVCGEIVDVDGPCGGYNLYWAFASAIKVAQSILRSTEN